MIKVSMFYPNTNGSKFDMSYYLKTHIPMVQQKLGAALKGASVEHGLGGGQAGSPPTFLAMGHLLSIRSKPSNRRGRRTAASASHRHIAS